MRILYFADIRFPLERANGIQTMETCYALAERGHRVDLVVRPDTRTPARDPFEYYGLPARDRLAIERAPVPAVRIPPTARRLAYLAFAAGRAAGTRRADVIMTRDLTVASLILRLPARAPLVYESHGYAPDVAEALPSLLSTAQPPSRSKVTRLARREADVWKRAEGYVTITHALAAELAARFGARDRLAVVPDGHRGSADPHHGSRDTDHGSRDTDYGSRDTDYTDHEIREADREIREADREIRAADRETGDADRTTTIGYAGHLYAWKGVDILLEALARVPGVHGLIVGGHDEEPDLARLEALADRLGLDSRVTFTGYVAPPRVAEKLLAADVLVLPNPPSAIATHATSPLKLFEYMATGKSIVASDLPAIREVLQHDVNAWLVTAGDAEALAEGIRRLTEDPQLRVRLARAARTAVAQYTWSRRAEQLEALFGLVSPVR